MLIHSRFGVRLAQSLGVRLTQTLLGEAVTMAREFAHALVYGFYRPYWVKR